MTQAVLDNIPEGASINVDNYNESDPTAKDSYLLVENLPASHPASVTGVKIYLNHADDIVINN